MLDEILHTTRNRIIPLVAREAEIRARAADRPRARDFAKALAAPGLQVIAEIKRRSPSAGILAAHLDSSAQAVAYEEGGAAAISVLTEPHYFDGSLGDLEAARTAVALPVLRKDFTVHAAQIWEARAHGADAVLLIVAALEDERLEELIGVARDAGLAALVEAHSEAEVDRALTAGAEIVGVNNRDLTTFVTDLATAERAVPGLGGATVTVAESGVSSPQAAQRMAAAGYDAILVGEAAVRASDPAAFVASLVEAGS